MDPLDQQRMQLAMSSITHMDPSSKLDPSKFNWPQWQSRMRQILVGKDLWALVEGDELAPEDVHSATYRVWKQRSNMAVSNIIMNFTPDNMLDLINTRLDAKALWTELTERFESKSLLTRQAILCEIANTLYIPGTDMFKHLSKLQQLRAQCEAIKVPMSDDTFIDAILVSLRNDKSWDHLFKSLPNDVTVNDIIKQLQSAYHRHAITGGSDPVALTACINGRPYCTHCK